MNEPERDIFISYAHEDLACARALAELLEELGWSVWFDREILVGADWETTLRRRVEGAACVVVLWSNAAVRSEWVQREAAIAQCRGVLIPAMLAGDDVPLAFRGEQHAILTGWRGGRLHLGIQHLLHSLRRALDRDAVQALGIDPDDLEPPGARSQQFEIGDFQRDVFVLSAGGQPFGTGFLLGTTSLLVTDSNVYNGLLYAAQRGHVNTLEATALEGGATFATALVLPPDHAQDFTLLDASPRIGTGSIGVATEAPALGTEVTCVVAVGAGRGLLTGRVTGTQTNENVAGVPGGPLRIENLLTTDIVTQQGSAGAPVVTLEGALIGVVVAGDHRRRSLLIGTSRLLQRLMSTRLLD